jgi:uncharacterized phage-associated protein
MGTNYKLKNLMLYLMERMNNVPMGKTKIMKLLYYIDFTHMAKHDVPVTGADYRKLPHGPVPMEAMALWSEMEVSHEIDVLKRQITPNNVELRPLPNIQSDMRWFNGEEIETIDAAISQWFWATAKAMEDASHREAPWLCTNDGDVIDYETAYYMNSDDGEDDRIADAFLSSDEFLREYQEHYKH